MSCFRPRCVLRLGDLERDESDRDGLAPSLSVRLDGNVVATRLQPQNRMQDKSIFVRREGREGEARNSLSCNVVRAQWVAVCCPPPLGVVKRVHCLCEEM